MSAKRWKQVEELFQTALAQEPGRRSAFLVGASNGDEDLRREVERLLAQNASLDERLERPALEGEGALRSVAGLLPGVGLGPYRIEAPLGAGGMGQVYKARDTRLGRQVAIKVVAEEFSNRFEREARAISGLNHPHICTLYDVGPCYLVMELVEGETLASRLKQGRLLMETVLRYGAQIADALAAAHAKGIIHRDLKPGNLMVTKSGIKVLDFGLAKIQQPDETLTASHVVQGTPAYMAPEQLERKPCDARTDIYALGLVLYEMATGKRLRQGEPPALHGLPYQFVHVFERCLDPDPERRWQSARDVQAELEWIAKSPARESRPTQSSRLTWMIAALAGAVLAIVVIGWSRSSVRPIANPSAVEFSVFPDKGTTFSLGGDGAPWPAISPDGRSLAFVALRSNGEQQIWIRPLDSSTSRPLEGTEGASRLFWSSDSRSVGYFANGQLVRVDLESGATRVVCEAPYLGGLAGTWAGDVIVFSRSGGLYRVRADGGPATIVIPDAGDIKQSSPTFLPDGRHFLYLARSARPEQRQLCLAELDRREPKCFPNVPSAVRFAPPGHILFLEGQALAAQSFDPHRLAVSGERLAMPGVAISTGFDFLPPFVWVSDTGVLSYRAESVTPLVWLDRSGTQLERVGTGSPQTVTRDGNRMIFVRSDRQTGNRDLWLHDRERGTESRLTFDLGQESGPRFSSDGEHVLFLSARNGTNKLYRKPVRGGTEEQVASIPIDAGNPDWSSDGRFILYHYQFDLWAISLTGDRKPFPVVQTAHGERAGRFSPDVRWVAYDSTESGPREIWVQPFPPTGSRWQVSTSGGTSPRWSGDGKELFYVAADGMLTVVPVESGSTFQWRAPKPLFQTMFRGGVYATYTPSHDGKRFLMNVPPGREDVTPITVVLNWTALLRK